VKLISANADVSVFEFRPRERQMLSAILQLYPLLNPDYHQITRPGASSEIVESEQLLREAMAEQRESSKKAVADFLDDGNWAARPNARLQVTMTPVQMQWLLQVLNDVRVGSWVKLGKPDAQSGDKLNVTIGDLPYAGALELSGYFQMVLLQAMSR
jgi:hypothetical protein